MRATGEGAFTLSQLQAVPPTIGFAAVGHYFDLELATGSAFGSLSIRDCNLGGGNALEWWDGSSWGAVRPQSYSPGPPACVTAVLGAGSSPSLSQLTGTPFAVARLLPPADGYWLAGRAGYVASYGQAASLGSPKRLAKPVVGIASTPDGHGYWLVGADGGIFSFGDARFFGSASSRHLAKPVVGIAST